MIKKDIIQDINDFASLSCSQTFDMKLRETVKLLADPYGKQKWNITDWCCSDIAVKPKYLGQTYNLL